MYWLKMWDTAAQRWVKHSLHQQRWTAKSHALALPRETKIVKATDADVRAWLADDKRVVAY